MDVRYEYGEWVITYSPWFKYQIWRDGVRITQNIKSLEWCLAFIDSES